VIELPFPLRYIVATPLPHSFRGQALYWVVWLHLQKALIFGGDKEARNQLGTPGEKSLLRGAQIF